MKKKKPHAKQIYKSEIFKVMKKKDVWTTNDIVKELGLKRGRIDYERVHKALHRGRLKGMFKETDGKHHGSTSYAYWMRVERQV